MLTHYKDWILKFGHPLHFSTKRFESSHVRIKKAAAIGKCRKTLLKTIMGKLYIFNNLNSINDDETNTAISNLRKSWKYDCEANDTVENLNDSFLSYIHENEVNKYKEITLLEYNNLVVEDYTQLDLSNEVEENNDEYEDLI
uniref:DDE_Tnp_1_7 domain-containing protein n=1 Tax=Strongyloides papillosus TaxID=174720 RepID=A0A0N5BYP7_STREA